jgi:hypothetical protein
LLTPRLMLADVPPSLCARPFASMSCCSRPRVAKLPCGPVAQTSTTGGPNPARRSGCCLARAFTIDCGSPTPLVRPEYTCPSAAVRVYATNLTCALSLSQSIAVSMPAATTFASDVAQPTRMPLRLTKSACCTAKRARSRTWRTEAKRVREVHGISTRKAVQIHAAREPDGVFLRERTPPTSCVRFQFAKFQWLLLLAAQALRFSIILFGAEAQTCILEPPNA